MNDLTKAIHEGLAEQFNRGKEIAILEAKAKIMRLSTHKDDDNIDVYEIMDLLDAMIADIKNNA